MMSTPWPALASATLCLVLGSWGVSILASESDRYRALEEGLGAGGNALGARARRSAGSRLSDTRWMKRLQTRLLAAGLTWPAGRAIITLVGAIVFILVVGHVFFGRIASTVLAALVPLLLFQWLEYRRTKRTQRFVAQLPELARMLANGSSAGLSMSRSLKLASTEMQEPSKTELAQIDAQLGLGWSIEQALQQLSERLPSREISVLFRTIVIQQRAGGELVRALQDIAGSLEDRKELRREVGTTILGSQVSGYVVILIGLGSIVLMNLMMPGVLDRMATSFFGQIALIVSGALFALGLVLMRLVSRIDA